MFKPSERLLCLHAEDGKISVVFSLHDEDYDPAVGHVDQIFGNRFRVIRRAEVEPQNDGHSYWVVHGLKMVDRYH